MEKTKKDLDSIKQDSKLSKIFFVRTNSIRLEVESLIRSIIYKSSDADSHEEEWLELQRQFEENHSELLECIQNPDFLDAKYEEYLQAEKERQEKMRARKAARTAKHAPRWRAENEPPMPPPPDDEPPQIPDLEDFFSSISIPANVFYVQESEDS